MAEFPFESCDKETTPDVTTASTTVTTSTTSTKNSAQNKTVLVLSSYGDTWNPAMLLDTNERQDELRCFSPDKDSQSGSLYFI